MSNDVRELRFVDSSKTQEFKYLETKHYFCTNKKIICKGPYYRPRDMHPHFLSCFPEEKSNDFACIVKHYL